MPKWFSHNESCTNFQNCNFNFGKFNGLTSFDLHPADPCQYAPPPPTDGEWYCQRNSSSGDLSCFIDCKPGQWGKECCAVLKTS